MKTGCNEKNFQPAENGRFTQGKIYDVPYWDVRLAAKAI